MKFKACILDDENLAIASLRVDLERFFPEIELVKTFNKPSEAIVFLNENVIDVLFLDIEMPEMKGIDFLDKIGKFNFDVIFTTAYDEFAIKAFKLNATDYILKPVLVEDLKLAINKVIEKKKHNTNINKPSKIALSDSTGIEFVHLDNILYCIADKNYTTFYFKNKTTKIVSKNIGEFEKLLDKSDFFRIHQSSIVNLNYISKLTKGDNTSIFMEDGNELSVSRAKKEDLINALNSFT